MFLRLSLGAVDVFVRYRTFCLLLAHKCFSLCVCVCVCVCGWVGGLWALSIAVGGGGAVAICLER